MGDSIILFDGICNLCNKTVQFIIAHDPGRKFRFASLQSDFGQQLLREKGMDTGTLKSFLLLENGRLYSKSTGALRVAKRLPGLWKLVYGLIIVPPFIRNAVYDWIAANRYKWFGKQQSCWLPTADLRSRFI